MRARVKAKTNRNKIRVRLVGLGELSVLVELDCAQMRQVVCVPSTMGYRFCISGKRKLLTILVHSRRIIALNERWQRNATLVGHEREQRHGAERIRVLDDLEPVLEVLKRLVLGHYMRKAGGDNRKNQLVRTTRQGECESHFHDKTPRLAHRHTRA